jgi:prophage DNA circulation protein
MLGIGATLANIIDFEVPPVTISSLAVAYDKYEDLDREKEIITRNIPVIKNPGFLPGGETIELLNE